MIIMVYTLSKLLVIVLQNQTPGLKIQVFGGQNIESQKALLYTQILSWVVYIITKIFIR